MNMSNKRAADILKNANLGGVLRQAADWAIEVLKYEDRMEEIITQQAFQNTLLTNKVLELDERLAMAEAERDAATKRMIELEQTKEG